MLELDVQNMITCEFLGSNSSIGLTSKCCQLCTQHLRNFVLRHKQQHVDLYAKNHKFKIGEGGINGLEKWFRWEVNEGADQITSIVGFA